jgi:hypothetical protein
MEGGKAGMREGRKAGRPGRLGRLGGWVAGRLGGWEVAAEAKTATGVGLLR